MSLTLTSYPVFTDEPGDTINIFPAYAPIELEFERQDALITSVTSGSGTNILVTISGDFTTLISEGDGVYVFSEGADYTYDDTGSVQSVSLNSGSTEIEVDIAFNRNR